MKSLFDSFQAIFINGVPSFVNKRGFNQQMALLIPVIWPAGNSKQSIKNAKMSLFQIENFITKT